MSNNIRRALLKLSKLVVKKRLELNISQGDFGKLIGISQASIFKLENQKYDKLPTHETLYALAEILKIEYWELIRLLYAEIDLDLDRGVAFNKGVVLSDLVKIQDKETCVELATTLLNLAQRLP